MLHVLDDCKGVIYKYNWLEMINKARYQTSGRLDRGSWTGNAGRRSSWPAANRTAAEGLKSCPLSWTAPGPWAELRGPQREIKVLEAPCRTAWWEWPHHRKVLWRETPRHYSAWSGHRKCKSCRFNRERTSYCSSQGPFTHTSFLVTTCLSH